MLRGRENSVYSVAFSPDSHILASGSQDQTIRLWIARTNHLAAMVCKQVTRNLTLNEWRRFVGEEIPYERTCENLPLHPSFLQHAEDQAQEGKINVAIDLFQQAQQLDLGLEISARPWHTLCRFGSLWNQASDVLPACQKAIALDASNGNFRDSYGIAQALTGDYAGAIENFQFFLQWGQDIVKPEVVSKHEAWLQTLQAGRNPFDDVTLKALRGE